MRKQARIILKYSKEDQVVSETDSMDKKCRELMWEEPCNEEQTKAVSCREIQTDTERSTSTLNNFKPVRQQDTTYP